MHVMRPASPTSSRRARRRICSAACVLLQTAVVAGGESAPQEIVESAYRAHIAAAHALLRLDDVPAARRWLDAAPEARRGWEWRYLQARIDASALTIRLGAGAYSIALAPDGSRIAAAAEDGSVSLYDARTGALVAKVAAHAGAAYGVAFSHDGTRLASSGRDRTVRLYDGMALEPVANNPVLTDPDSHVMGLAFSPDGSRLAATTLSHARIWNLATAEIERTLEGHVHGPPVVCVDWSDDGTRLATGSWDNSVILWDAATGDVIAKLGPGYGGGDFVQFRGVDFSPDGTLLAAAGSEGRLWLWDGKSGAEVDRIHAHAKESFALAFNHDGTRVATAGREGLVKVWDVASRARHATLRGHTGAVRTVRFGPDGLVASAGDDGTIRFFGAEERGEEFSWPAHENGPWGIDYTPDGLRLVTGSSDELVKVWDATSGTLMRSGAGHAGPVASVACSPDGARAASGGNDGTMRVWDLERGEVLFTSEAFGSQVRDVAWSADGRYLAACAGKKAELRDATDYALLATWTDRSPRRLAFGPAPQCLLAISDAEGGVRIIDPATREITRELRAEIDLHECAFDHSGRLLAVSASDGTIFVWDLAAGADQPRTLRGHGDVAYGLAFLDAGRRLASGAYDATVRIWDPVSGHELLSIESPEWVYALAASPDGGTIAWSAVNGRVVLSTAPAP